MQAELAQSSVQKPEIQECEHFTTQSAKLPKLVTTKFDGSCMNWTKFWDSLAKQLIKVLLRRLQSSRIFRSNFSPKQSVVLKPCP